MQIFTNISNNKKTSVLHTIPSELIYSPGVPATAVFDNGLECNIGCLSCNNPICMKFNISEINCSKIDTFPSAQIIDVCPVGAISWNNELKIPEFNNSKCIRCCVCMRRCPVGAIYYDGEVKLNLTSSTKIIERIVDDPQNRFEETQLHHLMQVDRKGLHLFESDELMIDIYQRLSEIDSNYHNMVVRSLLISLGTQCSIRRIGDVYTRMDAIYNSYDHCFGPLEVEFGRDTLDASRGILDDIAVLCARYNVRKTNITPLVVCLQLPNARQGYWQVVKDVSNVEHIAIQTITITLLALFSAMTAQNIVISAPVFREKKAPFELVALAHSWHKFSFPFHTFSYTFHTYTTELSV